MRLGGLGGLGVTSAKLGGPSFNLRVPDLCHLFGTKITAMGVGTVNSSQLQISPSEI